MELTNELRWYDATNCAITVCDAQGIIVYMNDKAKETFAKHGDLIGHNLFDCHSAASQEKIKEMLATGHSNAYTIERFAAWWKSLWLSPTKCPTTSAADNCQRVHRRL
jgi:PAS domain-containing protein